MKERCSYCGRSYSHLSIIFVQEREPLCSCCNHCPDCKLLVLQHKVKDKPVDFKYGYKDDDYNYVFKDSRFDDRKD